MAAIRWRQCGPIGRARDAQCFKICVFYPHDRAGARAVDLGGPSVHQGRPKFEVKHNSRCLQKSKLVDWRGQACRLGGAMPLLGAGPATRILQTDFGISEHLPEDQLGLANQLDPKQRLIKKLAKINFNYDAKPLQHASYNML